MCVLCHLDPVNAYNGGHEAASESSGGSFTPVYALEPDGDIDYGATPFTYFVGQEGSGDQNIDGLLSGYMWTDVELTFSFPDSITDYNYGQSDHSGLSEFSAKQKAAAEFWLDNAAAVSGLTFTLLDGADGALDADSEAQLKFVNSPDPSTAYAYYPFSSAVGGDMFFGNSGDNPDLGDYDWATVGHELGHALGLSHGHTSNGGFGAMNADRDGLEFSIMTYRSYVGDPLNGGYSNGSSDFPQTLMMYDIAALQHMYGANFDTNAGATTYTFNSGGEMFVNGVGQGDPIGSEIFLTIWDGNGEDTYDFSNFSRDLEIDLTPGGWTDLDANGNAQQAWLGDGNYANGHVYNAVQYQGDERSLIENAEGGSGDDSILGNQADNLLSGNGGSDTLTGGAGDDALSGGVGDDFAVFLLDFAEYSFEIAGDFLTVIGEGVDTVWNDIETLVFNDFSETFDAIFASVNGGGGEAPTPQNDALAAMADLALAADVFADNGSGIDSDPDGDALTLVSVNGETDGSVTLASGARVDFASDGSITFDAKGAHDALGVGETAEETFTYTVSDGTGNEASATVIVTVTGVNDGPVARADAVTAGENGLATGNLLANNGFGADSDIDGDALIVTAINGDIDGVVTLASGAVITFDGAGDFTYDSNGLIEGLGAGESTTESFEYTISDGNGGTDTATATITLVGRNDDPIARNDTLAVDEDGVVEANLLADNGNGADTDPEGDALSLIAINGEAGGFLTLGSGATVSFGADGSISFDANGAYDYLAAGETATETLTYTIADPAGGEATATATIIVTGANDGPVARDDAFEAAEDGATAADLFADNGAGADSDIDGGALTLVSVAGQTGGTATLGSGAILTFDASGSITFDANGAYETLGVGDMATELVEYVVSDGQGGVATATATITIVGSNDGPVAFNDSLSIGEDGSAIFDLTDDNGFGRDFDIDGDALEIVDVNGQSGGFAQLASGAGIEYGGGQIAFIAAGAYEELGAGETAIEVLTYTIADGNGGEATATATITIFGANDGPTAANDQLSVAEDSALFANLFADNGAGADSDIDGDALTLVSIGGQSGGVATLSSGARVEFTAGGDIVFDAAGYDTLAAGDTATETFSYTVSDGNGGEATATATIVIEGVNDAPEASAVSVSGDEDGLITGALSAQDIDGDALTYSLLSGPSHGEVVIAPDGAFTYAPAADYSGDDNFTYLVTDPSGATSSATISLTIAPVNDAPTAVSESFDLEEDGVLAGALSASDVEGDAVSFALAEDGAPAHGVVEIGADGGFIYTPAANYFGEDSFTYVATDANGASATATISLTIAAVNDAPVAEAQSFEGEEDAPIQGQLIATDVEPGDLTFALAEGGAPASGVVEIDANGGFVYTPSVDFYGDDAFTYIVTDAGGATTTATATVTVSPINDAPKPAAMTFSVEEDSALNGVLTATDAEGGAMTFALAEGGAPAHGSVQIAADGGFVYTPDGDFFGADSFTYQVTDLEGATSTAVVDVTVDPVNDSPVATGQSFDGEEDGVIEGALDATDVESATLTYLVAENGAPAHGSLAIGPDGTFTYTPDANYNGPDSFTYHAIDADGAAATATVQLTIASVNDAPVAEAAAVSGAEDEIVTGQLAASDVEGGDLIFALADGGAPEHGQVEIGADGAFSYQPNADYFGEDAFTYQVTDADGAVSTATITINIAPINDAPVAEAMAFSGAEDSAITGALVATDVEPGDLAFSLAADGAPAHGAVEIDADGGFTYTPDENYSGEDSFSYQVVDAAGAVSTATVSLTLSPVNDAPVAEALSFEGLEDNAISGVLSATDIEGDALSFALATGGAPEHGVVEISADGQFTYSPDENYFGADAFTYIVTDAFGATSFATVGLNVIAVNDHPFAQDLAFEGEEDGPVQGVLLASDVETANLVFSLAEGGAPSNGSVEIAENGGFVYTPNADFFGVDSFVALVADEDGAIDTALVTITVASVNDAPVAADLALDGAEDGLIEGQLAASDVEPGELVFALAVDGAPQHGVVEIGADGGFAYQPDENYFGTDAFTYSVTDADGAVTTATVTLTVSAVNDAPVATAQSFSATEDETLQGALTALDVEGDAITFALTPDGGAAHGTLELSENGGFLYTPDADFAGEDQFTYSVTDANGATTTATATISVAPVNDAPEAGDLSLTGFEDAALAGELPVFDADGDELSYAIAAGGGPDHGEVSFDQDGNFLYTPDADYHGRDSFTYQVTDAAGAVATGTVDLRLAKVNDNPKGKGKKQRTLEDQALVGALEATDVDEDNLTFALANDGAPRNGRVVIGAEGDFTYTPDADFAGVDEFSFLVSDGEGGESTAMIEIGIESVNDAPEAADDAFAVTANEAFSGNLFGDNGAGRDTDIDGDAFALTAIDGVVVTDGQTVTLGSGAVVTVFANGDFTYETGDAFNGLGAGNSAQDGFDYTIADGGGLESTARASFDIDGADQPLTGGDGKDELSGDNGDDEIDGGRGADELSGGGGADTLMGGGGKDTVFGGSGGDDLNGGGGQDSLDGGSGNDMLNGGGGRDVLIGGRGNDTLDGGGGRDLLNGGKGADVLIGGRGRDTFEFRPGDGRDTIEDFQQGRDKIAIDGASFATLNISQAGADVRIQAAGLRITVEDEKTTDFNANDFIF